MIIRAEQMEAKVMLVRFVSQSVHVNWTKRQEIKTLFCGPAKLSVRLLMNLLIELNMFHMLLNDLHFILSVT